MGSRIQVCLLVISVQNLLVGAQMNNLDFAALNALKEIWNNTPLNWVGSDPCGDSWEGIRCTNSRVTSITLASMGLTGQLSGDIQGLSELRTLDLSYNNGLTGSLPRSIGNLTKLSNLFSGPIPETIGSLQQLSILSLTSNSFSGPIPPSIGNLSNLYWLDLSVNKLSGTIPVSPGLDMLVNAKHFHCGRNQFSGEIPSQLFNANMSLIHVLFGNNKLSGKIPSTLGLVKTLEILFLSNNQLTGPFPDLTGLNSLNHVDLSNNTFDKSDFPPWLGTLQSLETLYVSLSLSLSLNKHACNLKYFIPWCFLGLCCKQLKHCSQLS
ncbi:hypothetical protein CsSME_00025144 [Camellia sinensis var. sinensis]